MRALALILLATSLCAVPSRAATFNVRTYGIKGDGTTLDTAAMQRAIGAAVITLGSETSGGFRNIEADNLTGLGHIAAATPSSQDKNP